MRPFLPAFKKQLLFTWIAIAFFLVLPAKGQSQLLFPQPTSEAENTTSIDSSASKDSASKPIGQYSNSDPDLMSPALALNTFLKGYENWDTDSGEQAMKTMDLSYINRKIRKRRGAELAEILYQILTQQKKTAPPPQTGSNEWTVFRHSQGDISILKDSTGNWKFSATSMRQVENIYGDLLLQSGGGNVAPARSLSLQIKQMMFQLHPGFIKKSFLIQNWQWLALFILVVIGTLIHGISTLFSHRVFSRLIWKSQLTSKNLRKDIGKPLGILLASIFWQFTLPILGLSAGAELILQVAVRFLFSISTIWFLWRLADWVCDNLAIKADKTENKFDDLLVPMLRTALRIFVISTGLLIIADALDLPIYTLLSGLTIGSVALALAAKDTVENLFGSVTVLLDRPFNIGDWIVIGDLEGTVEKLGFRSTRVRTFYNSLITIPNSRMIKAEVDNLGARSYRRIKTNLAITYDTPPEKIVAFCEGIRQLILSHPYTRKDYYHVYFNQFGASSLDVLLYCFVQVPDWGTELRERERLFLDILRLASTLEIDFAFPTQTLHMYQETRLEKDKRAWSETEIKAYSEGLSEQHRSPEGKIPPPVVY